jgi:hypothetical protein
MDLRMDVLRLDRLPLDILPRHHLKKKRYCIGRDNCTHGGHSTVNDLLRVESLSWNTTSFQFAALFIAVRGTSPNGVD